MGEKFNGFEPPQSNYFKVPNAYWSITDLTANQEHVLLYILRHTWGYQEFGIFKAMTIDEIQNGRKRADGSRMDAGTRFSRNSVISHTKALEEKGYIEIQTDDTDKARIKKSYRLKTSQSDVQNLHPGGQNLHPDQRKTLRKDKEDEGPPLPPIGGTVPELQNPEPPPIKIKKEVDTELEAMKHAVKKHLKAYGKHGTKIAKTLINRHTGKSAEYNVGGAAFTPEDVEQFGLWWDRGHHNFRTHRPLTRPSNMGSVQTWFSAWRDEVAKSQLIASEPEPVYESFPPIDVFAESIFDKPRRAVS